MNPSSSQATQSLLSSATNHQILSSSSYITTTTTTSTIISNFFSNNNNNNISSIISPNTINSLPPITSNVNDIFYNTSHNMNSTYLYTFGPEKQFLMYGIPYHAISLLFESIMIVLSATPLISKKGRTLQKKILLAACMTIGLLEFLANPFEVLKIFHPVIDRSISNVGKRYFNKHKRESLKERYRKALLHTAQYTDVVKDITEIDFDEWSDDVFSDASNFSGITNVNSQMSSITNNSQQPMLLNNNNTNTNTNGSINEIGNNMMMTTNNKIKNPIINHHQRILSGGNNYLSPLRSRSSSNSSGVSGSSSPVFGGNSPTMLSPPTSNNFSNVYNNNNIHNNNTIMNHNMNTNNNLSLFTNNNNPTMPYNRDIELIEHHAVTHHAAATTSSSLDITSSLKGNNHHLHSPPPYGSNYHHQPTNSITSTNGLTTISSSNGTGSNQSITNNNNNSSMNNTNNININHNRTTTNNNLLHPNNASLLTPPPTTNNFLTIPTRDRKTSNASVTSEHSQASSNTGLLHHGNHNANHNHSNLHAAFSRERNISNVSELPTFSEIEEVYESVPMAHALQPSSSFYKKFKKSKTVNFFKYSKHFMIGTISLYLFLSAIDIFILAFFFLWDFFDGTLSNFPSLDYYPYAAIVISLFLCILMICHILNNFIQSCMLCISLTCLENNERLKTAIFGIPFPSSGEDRKLAMQIYEKLQIRSILVVLCFFMQLLIGLLIALYPIFYHLFNLQGISYFYQMLFYFGRKVLSFGLIISVMMIYVPFYLLYHFITKEQTTKRKAIRMW